MSVWRNFLAAVLPWLFKTGEAAAEAAVAKQDAGKAAADAAKGAVDDPKVVAAATDVVTETVKKVKGK